MLDPDSCCTPPVLLHSVAAHKHCGLHDLFSVESCIPYRLEGCLRPGGALAQAPEEPEEGLEVDAAAGTFRLDGVTYRPGDTVFVMPDTFDQCAAAIEDTRNAVPDFAAKSRHVKVSCTVSLSCTVSP